MRLGRRRTEDGAGVLPRLATMLDVEARTAKLDINCCASTAACPVLPPVLIHTDARVPTRPLQPRVCMCGGSLSARRRRAARLRRCIRATRRLIRQRATRSSREDRWASPLAIGQARDNARRHRVADGRAPDAHPRPGPHARAAGCRGSGPGSPATTLRPLPACVGRALAVVSLDHQRIWWMCSVCGRDAAAAGEPLARCVLWHKRWRHGRRTQTEKNEGACCQLFACRNAETRAEKSS